MTVVIYSLVFVTFNRYAVAYVTYPTFTTSSNSLGKSATATPGFVTASVFTSTSVYPQTPSGTGGGGGNSNTGSTRREVVAVKIDKLEDRIIPGDTVSARSQLECMVRCAEKPECMSFFYETPTQTCHIHEIVFISRNDSEPCEGTSYYVVGDKNDCPVFEGFIHKRSINFCYRIVTGSMNATDAARTCSALGGEYGFHLTPEVYDHLTAVFKASFLLRKRKFWTGMKFDEESRLFTFNGGSRPEFDRWLYGAGPPDGAVNDCIQTEPDISYLWEVVPCHRTRAFVCKYMYGSP